LAVAAVTMVAACTPPDGSQTSTTTTPTSVPTVNLFGAFYEPFGPGVSLEWTMLGLGSDQAVTDYVYEMSCDGGVTVFSTGHLNLTFRTSNVYEACDSGATPSSFRLAAVVNSASTTPYSSWVTVPALEAVTLTSATVVQGGVMLAFVLPTPLPNGEDAINSLHYDLSCDGGATVFAGGGISTWDGVNTMAKVTATCAGGPSTYRVYGTVANWLMPRSAWVTAHS
jgi:hypothetical protein